MDDAELTLELRSVGLIDATLIGSGGSALVFRATDTRFRGRPVAAKVFLQDVGDVEMAAFAAIPDHPNIISALEARTTTESDRLVLVTPFMSGGTLQDRIDRRRLSGEEVLDVVADVASGLAAVHAAGITHRDVKPSNVFDGPSSQLGDFGAAIAADAAAGAPIVCTPAYASPELLAGRPPDAAADVYSLGLTGMTALLGSNPVDRPGDDPQQLMFRIMSGEADASTTRPPSGVDPGLWRLLVRMVGPVEERPTAAAVGAEIDRLRRRLSPRRRIAIAAIALVALGAVVFGVTVVLADDATAPPQVRFAEPVDGDGPDTAAPPAPAYILGGVLWPPAVDQDARIRIVFGAEIDPLLDAEHRWQLLADGQVLATAQGNDGIPLSTMGVEAGVYELTVRLTDGLDRSAEETIRIRIGPP
ncbi:MAG: serine/threonine-protein kinase, partial [Actinomycetota bacterium]